MKTVFSKLSIAIALMALTNHANAFCPTDGQIEGGEVSIVRGACVIKATTSIIVIDENGNETITGKQAVLRSDFTFKAGKTYGLIGGFHIGDNKMRTTPEGVANKVTLTLEKNVTIIGSNPKSYIQVDRGGKIVTVTEGENATSKDEPVVMTTAQKPGRRKGGQWGGLVINGSAPVSCKGIVSDSPCELEGEGFGAYKYGGPLVDDNSGVLKYLRVEYAGFAISDGNELNGIAFQGVGNATVVDHIQVHANADDGIEFFGGTVNASHVILTAIGDDSLDWTAGWNGTMTNVIIHQIDGVDFTDGPYGIEGENQKPNDATPRSQPTLKNFTVIGASHPGAKAGAQFKKGSGGYIYNSYFTGWNSSACVQIDGAETWRNANEGNVENGQTPGLTFTNTVLNCDTKFKSSDIEGVDFANWFMNQTGNDFREISLSGYVPMDPNQINLTNGEYIGAVKSADDKWFEGNWTNFELN